MPHIFTVKKLVWSDEARAAAAEARRGGGSEGVGAGKAAPEGPSEGGEVTPQIRSAGKKATGLVKEAIGKGTGHTKINTWYNDEDNIEVNVTRDDDNEADLTAGQQRKIDKIAAAHGFEFRDISGGGGDEITYLYEPKRVA